MKLIWLSTLASLKDKDYDYVLKDIMVVKHACGKHVLKVIVETALLTKEEIEKVTEIVMQSGAEFIKTSTGFFNSWCKLRRC